MKPTCLLTLSLNTSVQLDSVLSLALVMNRTGGTMVIYRGHLVLGPCLGLGLLGYASCH